jgi:hypothetical protein
VVQHFSPFNVIKLNKFAIDKFGFDNFGFDEIGLHGMRQFRNISDSSISFCDWKLSTLWLHQTNTRIDHKKDMMEGY